MIRFILNILIGLTLVVHVLAEATATVSIQLENVIGSKCPAIAVNSFLSILFAQPLRIIFDLLHLYHSGEHFQTEVSLLLSVLQHAFSSTQFLF
jgi:hypothetical protein